ncbi:MAG TPA: preprotein translocase subunit SecG [Candidatus Cybelea sp.]|nr:preprotein translocase subunit SecG [Candidatus Cybelea sp.]
MNPFILIAAAAPKVVPAAAATLLPKGALPPNVPAMPAGPPPTTWFAQHLPWFTHGLAGIFTISALLLIFLLAVQTTKQEGLTGSIGGRVESAYHGRLGAEEQLKRWTGFVAVVFVAAGFALSLTGI